MSKTLQGNILLLVTAILWGVAFIYQKEATDHTDALTFNAIRFSIASVAVLWLFVLPKKLFEEHQYPSDSKKQFGWLTIGFVGGVFLFLAISLQQWGLSYTSAGKSGFITGLYIVMVPILALFLRQPCGREVWLGAVLACFGIYILNVGGDASSKLNIGDLITFISAWGWAGQILWLSIYAKYSSVIKVVFMQMLTCALLSIIAMILFALLGLIEPPDIYMTLMENKMAFFYTGVISTAVAFSLQVIGQRLIPPANAALIMSLESFFALIAGVLFLDEKLTITLIAGCGLMFIGILMAQAKELRSKS